MTVLLRSWTCITTAKRSQPEESGNVKVTTLGGRVCILVDEFLAVPTTSYQERSLGTALLMFLDAGPKTALHCADHRANHCAELLSETVLLSVLGGVLALAGLGV